MEQVRRGPRPIAPPSRELQGPSRPLSATTPHYSRESDPDSASNTKTSENKNTSEIEKNAENTIHEHDRAEERDERAWDDRRDERNVKSAHAWTGPRATFRVPIARDATGHDVVPDEAAAKPFTCLDCGTIVMLRRAHERDGSPVRAHFAHRPAVGCAFSEGEGEQHLRAKQRIFELVAARTTITLVRRCRTCDGAHRQTLPNRVVRASLEHRLLSGRRADVALLDTEDNLLAVFEVLETHAVDEDKRIDLADLRWCEIRAAVILSGEEWELVQDQLLPFTCPRCRYTAVSPWLGPERLEVPCPIPNAGTVGPVETCSNCSYFLEASREGVRCWGAAAS
jgi:competence protein CoiA-like protein